MRIRSKVMLQVVLTLGLTLPALSFAQEEPPVLVFISWDGSPGWLIEQLLDDGQLPNLARLAERGVFVKHTVGNWPSLTAAGHAAAFTGAFGNVSGITGNGVPLAPFSEHPIGAGTTSGFSADNLLAEPIWITAARQGRSSAMISVTQSSPFEMYTAEDYVSPQGAPAFGDFSDQLLIVDPYAAISTGANVVSASLLELELRESDGSGWSGLPAAGPYCEFTLGEEGGTLGGILYAGNGSVLGVVHRSGTKLTLRQTVPFRVARFAQRSLLGTCFAGVFVKNCLQKRQTLLAKSTRWTFGFRNSTTFNALYGIAGLN